MRAPRAPSSARRQERVSVQASPFAFARGRFGVPPHSPATCAGAHAGATEGDPLEIEDVVEPPLDESAVQREASPPAGDASAAPAPSAASSAAAPASEQTPQPVEAATPAADAALDARLTAETADDKQ